MLLIIYILLIFTLSLAPSTVASSVQFGGIDKIIHFIEYLILGLIFSNSKYKDRNILLFIVFLVPFLDELIVQSYSGRNVDSFDLLANLLGLISILFYKKDLPFKNKQK